MPTRLPDGEWFNWACNECGSKSRSNAVALDCEELCKKKQVEKDIGYGVPLSEIEEALDNKENNPHQHSEAVDPGEEPSACVDGLACLLGNILGSHDNPEDHSKEASEQLRKIRDLVSTLRQDAQVDADTIRLLRRILAATEPAKLTTGDPVDAAIEAMNSGGRG